jgi:TRAP-type C4-dicarboxylate transport system permease small subunit
MKYLDQFEKIIALLALVFLMFEIACLLGLFLLTLFDIGAMATGISFRGGVEFGEYLLVSIVFSGLGYAQLKRSHIRVEFLIRKIHPRVRSFIEIFTLLLCTLFFGLMAGQIGKEAYIAWVQKIYHPGWISAAIPTWPPILVAFLGCVILVISFLTQLTRSLGDILRKDFAK